MLRKIKSDYFLKFLMKEHLSDEKYFSIINYNKSFQKILEVSLFDYINIYYQIKIELTLIKHLKEEKNFFIRINNDNKKFFHIFINNRKEEKNYIIKDEFNFNPKIKIRIDKEIDNLTGLFKNCKSIQEINFVRFNRNNIINMNEMFYGCESLIKLNVDKLKTEKVINMGEMFYKCSSLKELNLSNFIFDNVDNTFEMFAFCTSLNKLEINNFFINKRMNTRFMFSHCSEELKEEIETMLTWKRFSNDVFGGEKEFGDYIACLSNYQMAFYFNTTEKLGDYTLYGIKSSENESAFLASLGEEKRAFDAVAFDKSSYPEEEVRKFAAENSDLFDTFSLSVITVQEESQAKKLHAQITNNEITFEDGITTYSEKYFSDGYGVVEQNFA